MLDIATTTSASVHALTGSSRPGAVPPLAVPTPLALGHSCAHAGALTDRPDAEVIDLAERVTALARREERLTLRHSMIDDAIQAACPDLLPTPESPGIAAFENGMVDGVLVEVFTVRTNAQASTRYKESMDARAARVAEIKTFLETEGQRRGLPRLEKLRRRMYRRLIRWSDRLTVLHPLTAAGVKAKAAALCAVHDGGNDDHWVTNLTTSVSADALRMICAEADARSEQDRQADGELLALGRAWRDCADRLDRAVVAKSEAEGQLTLPVPPEGLFFNPKTDAPVIGAYSEVHYETGRRWFGETGTINKLRGTWHYDFCRTRRDDIVAMYDIWAAAQQVEVDAVGLPAAAAEVTRLAAENLALRRGILSISAQTLDGVRVKMSVAAWCMGGRGSMDHELEGLLRSGEANDEAFALAVVLDATRVLGRDAGPSVAPISQVRSAPLSPIEFPHGRYPVGLSREVIETYRTFLAMELRYLDHEIYGRHEGPLHLYMNNSAGRMHGGSEPPPSTRAAAVLGLLGLVPEGADAAVSFPIESAA